MKAELATRSERASRGVIPEHRHKEILESARAETRAAVEKEFREQFQWTEGIEARDGQSFREAFQEYQRDPLAALQRAAQAQGEERLRSWAAQVLNRGRQAAKADTPDPMPEPDAENGAAYSRQGLQALLEWNRRQVRAEMQKELNPLIEAEKARTEQQQREQQERAAHDYAVQVHEEAKSWPHFEANRQQILTAFKALPWKSDDDTARNLYRAYIQVVVPTLESATTRQVVADLGEKANRGTTTHPTRGTMTTPASAPASFQAVMAEELAKHRKS
jgi:hypothetical protein